jgi:hypothetical protein
MKCRFEVYSLTDRNGNVKCGSTFIQIESEENMTDEAKNFFGGFAIGILFMFCIMIIVTKVVHQKGFEHGQISALTGDVQIELITKPDSTRNWVFKKDK